MPTSSPAEQPSSNLTVPQPDTQDPFKSLLNEFQQDQDLIHLDESDVFERLAIFSTISKEHGEGFEFEPLCVGGPQDLSLDGIGIIVNGTLITSTPLATMRSAKTAGACA